MENYNHIFNVIYGLAFSVLFLYTLYVFDRLDEKRQKREIEKDLSKIK